MQIAEFLRRRITEDERAASAAASAGVAGWHVAGSPRSDDEGPVEFDPTVYDEIMPSEEEAVHIVRHDPARVLRDVLAKRGIVDRHAPVDGGAGAVSCAWDRTPYPCLDLRDLATTYLDHPDFDDDWKTS
ncbi:DUF6221 family protein [Umezawaea beigongshangensis]|uniref:DUF6221 family protein n=1 Tax=Umezawaea beigongshangensis TaxID=2780383 RepID=UPI0018F22CBB|nr:DUF6221 family protein [Umezawaea beigongshangensis]